MLIRCILFYWSSSSITYVLISKTAQWTMCESIMSSVFLGSYGTSVFNFILCKLSWCVLCLKVIILITFLSVLWPICMSLGFCPQDKSWWLKYLSFLWFILHLFIYSLDIGYLRFGDVELNSSLKSLHFLYNIPSNQPDVFICSLYFKTIL